MRKTRKASRLLFYVTFFILSVAFGVLIVANGKKWYERVKQEKEIVAMQEEIARLRSEEEGQRFLLEKLQSPFFIEREGREKFGAKKPGENVVLFPKRENTEEEKSAVEEGRDDPPFFAKWFQYFFPTVMPK